MKYAIFDMDGTLIDSMPLWREVADRWCADRGLQPTWDATELFHQMMIPQAAAFLKEDFRIDDSIETITESLKAYAFDGYLHRVPAKPGVMEALVAFQRAGFQLAVATANERSLVDAVLARLGMSAYFSCVRTCEEAGGSKRQSPMVYLDCLHAMGGSDPQEAYVFEDAPHAAESAAKGGFQVIGVHDDSYAAGEERIRSVAKAFFYSAELWPTLLEPGDNHV